MVPMGAYLSVSPTQTGASGGRLCLVQFAFPGLVACPHQKHFINA